MFIEWNCSYSETMSCCQKELWRITRHGPCSLAERWMVGNPHLSEVFAPAENSVACTPLKITSPNDSIDLFNCSQMKFVAIILVLSVFLGDFSLDRFFMINRKLPAGIKCSLSLSAVSAPNVLETNTYVVPRGVLWGWRPLHCSPPTIALWPPTPQCNPPLPPFPATDEQPLAKNTQIYTVFTIFFQDFLKKFWFLLVLGVRNLRLCYRLVSTDNGIVSIF